MKCHKSRLPSRNPGLQQALIWPMWNGSQLWFPFISAWLFSSVAKENSAAIINPGPNSQEVQSSTANELAHSLSQHFPGQHSGHGTVRTWNSGRAPTQQHWAQATWSSPLTTAPRTQQGNPWGQGSQGKKGDNNNSPCHVNKVTHFKILPLTPLPPIPQTMFRNGPCLKLNHTTQFKCSSLFWWAGELSYMDMAIAHQMLQGWEWSWACPNRHYRFSTLAVHPCIFQLFPLQEKKGEFFSTLLKWFETLKWKLLYNCKALLIKKTVTFLQYITNKFWFLKGQLTTELLIQIYQLIN